MAMPREWASVVSGQREDGGWRDLLLPVACALGGLLAFAITEATDLPLLAGVVLAIILSAAGAFGSRILTRRR